jgi:hypothetical protein
LVNESGSLYVRTMRTLRFATTTRLSARGADMPRTHLQPRSRSAVQWCAVAALVLGSLLLVPAQAEARAGTARVSAPASAIEGERFTVKARIATPRKAKKVEFQAFSTDLWGNATWRTLRTLRVRKHATRSMSVLADDSSALKVRAVVTYTGAKKKSVSKPVVIKYWHWTPLGRFQHYASSGFAVDSGYISFAMNGRSWKGWYAGSSSAETRYTLGRNCTRFKGYVGLTDDSADGASGRITLSVVTPQNSLQTIYTSPTLRPGSTVALDVRVAAPYRFAIAGQNTSAPIDDRGTLPNARPAIGDAEFLCHFSE